MATAAAQGVAGKAARYLIEGRLTVVAVDPVAKTATATCRGGQVYDLVFDGVSWWCSCPARRDCAHLLAVRRVVTVDLQERP